VSAAWLAGGGLALDGGALDGSALAGEGLGVGVLGVLDGVAVGVPVAVPLAVAVGVAVLVPPASNEGGVVGVEPDEQADTDAVVSMAMAAQPRTVPRRRRQPWI
jgi:hypothetical protein